MQGLRYTYIRDVCVYIQTVIVTVEREISLIFLFSGIKESKYAHLKNSLNVL